MMTLSRWMSPPKSQNKSRNDLVATLISAVDNCLKSLRKTSRRLPPTVSSHSSETQILQRILYKNKNQHGRTLFFRNLVEMKRLACRIEETNLAKLVESTRAAFYSNEVASSSAWKSSPWSQIPDARFLESILQRINGLIQLYRKAVDAYKKASIAFSRFSHSTAFLPLTITALGVAGRLCMLAIEFAHVAQSVWSEVHRLLADIEPRHQACKCKSMQLPENLDLWSEPVEELPALPVSTSNPDLELGETVTREMVVGLSLKTEPLSHQVSETQSMVDVDMREAEDMIPFEATAPVIRSVPALVSSPDAADIALVNQPKKRKRKKRQLDEIDSIFG